MRDFLFHDLIKRNGGERCETLHHGCTGELLFMGPEYPLSVQIGGGSLDTFMEMMQEMMGMGDAERKIQREWNKVMCTCGNCPQP